MDQLATAISAACSQAMQPLRDELEEVKAIQHAAIELFQNRFAELRAQMSEQAEQIQALKTENAALKASQTHELPRDHEYFFRQELEKIRQSNHTTGQSLQEKVAALQTLQNQQSAAIQGLNRSLFSPSRNNGRVSTKDFDALRQQFDGLTQTLGALDTQCASLVQASNEQAAQMQRLSDSLGTQHEHAEALVGVRDFLARLQEVQNGQVRMIEVFAAEQDGMKQAISRLEAGGATSVSAPQASGQTVAVARRTEERSIALLNDSVAQLDQRLGSSERDADVLREEMLALTRTMIDVTRMMGNAARQPGGQAARVDYLQRSLMPKNEEPTVNPMDLLLLSEGHDAEDEDMTEDQDDQEPEEVTPVSGGFVLGEEDVQESIETNEEGGEFHAVETGLGLDPSSDEPASGSKDANQVMSATDGLTRHALTTQCHGCGRSSSASWHRGPAGPKTLCNTCYRKQVKTKNGAKSRFSEVVGDNKTDGVENSDAAARDNSSASIATLRGYEQKENTTKGAGEKALRRKKGLSPLKETFAVQGQPTKDAASFSTRSPIAKLSKTSYYLADRSRTLDSSAPSPGFVPGAENAQSTETTATKRKRMNADEKAPLLANELVADSGSTAGKKRRRTGAGKTVKFDLGGAVEGFIGGEEETVDGAPTGYAAKADAFGSNAAASKMGEGRKSSVPANGIEMAALECESPAAPKLRVRGGRTGRTAASSAPKPAPTTPVAEHEDVDVSSDNIVVARRKSSVSRRSPSAEIPSSGRKDTEAVKETIEDVVVSNGVLSDVMESEDELALPAAPRMKVVKGNGNVRSKNTAASVFSASAEKGDGEGKSDYQTLLSAFNLGSKGKPRGEEAEKTTASTASKIARGAPGYLGDGLKENARPKRMVKPKTLFGDIVDLTTVTEDELGN